jgi:hypothetical protein
VPVFPVRAVSVFVFVVHDFPPAHIYTREKRFCFNFGSISCKK